MEMRLKVASVCLLGLLVGSLGSVQAQTVSIITGQGTSDASGIPASQARMNAGSTTVVAPDGTVYFTEQNGRVRKITPAGIISTIAGRDVFDCGFAGDGGPAIAARLCYPTGIARDSAGNLYIADGGNNRIRRIAATTGVITTIAGNHDYMGDQNFSGDGGPAIDAGLDWPSWMAFAANGDLYFSDEGNNRVRKITPAGIISTVAGSGPVGWSWPEQSYAGDGGPATAALLNGVQGLAFDSHGNLYIADLANHRIRMVTPAGVISTIAGSGPHGGSIGGSIGGFSGDGGSALAAQLSRPQGLAIDAADNLYVADANNYRIRKITPGGMISTVVGNGTMEVMDGAQASQTGIQPWSVSTNASGDLYIDHLFGARGMLLKVDMPTVCGQGSGGAACVVNGVEEGIVGALDAGQITRQTATALLRQLELIQANLSRLQANPSNLQRLQTSSSSTMTKYATCIGILLFNGTLDFFVQIRRLPSSYRDSWKVDMRNVSARIGCR